MSYFNIFPDISYPYNADGDRKIAKNILKRFTFKDSIKNNGDIFVRYTMRESDTYESLAKKLYGSADLHWILFLMNEIQDPYEDLPKNSTDIQLFINQKYPGYAVFMDLDSYQGDFSIGETVTGANGYSGTVVSWDGTLRKLVVNSESGSSSLVKDELITGSSSNAVARYQRRVRNDVCVHHFEDSFGNVLSALPNPVDATYASPLQGYLDQTEQAGVVTITNTDYEESENRKKRQIKILKVELRDQILADAERVFK